MKRLAPLAISEHNEQGASLVEFALVVLILFIIVFGIIDFGLFFYNDLVLTQAARDAVRYLSASNTSGANTSIDTAAAQLIATSVTNRTLTEGNHGDPSQVTLIASYSAITPLPGLIGIGNTLTIQTSAVMRTE